MTDWTPKNSEDVLAAISGLTMALSDDMPLWQWQCLRARVQASLIMEDQGVEDEELVAGIVRHCIAELERLLDPNWKEANKH